MEELFSAGEEDEHFLRGSCCSPHALQTVVVWHCRSSVCPVLSLYFCLSVRVTDRKDGVSALWAFSIHQCCLNMCFVQCCSSQVGLSSLWDSINPRQSFITVQTESFTNLSWSNGSPNDLFWSCKKVPPTYLFYWSINRFLGSFSGVSGSVNRYEDRLQTLFWSNLTDTTLCKIDTGSHFRTTPHGTTDSDMRVRTQCAPVTFMLAEPRAYKQ